MPYYVVQVQTTQEEKFLTFAREEVGFDVQFYWPRRKLFIRKRGKTRPKLAPIFPGYIFVETEGISEALYWSLRRTPAFLRFLKDNQDIRPLSHRDQELLLHFLGYGEIVETSKVKFDENSRIQVLEGPLKGLEGRIVKVDKRKGRAKVRLDMYDDSFLIDFGFEDMQRVS
jgi:transcriptional antiterminator NusG